MKISYRILGSINNKIKLAVALLKNALHVSGVREKKAGALITQQKLINVMNRKSLLNKMYYTRIHEKLLAFS